MSQKNLQQAKDAFLSRHPGLTNLVDRLMQTEDAETLLKRFEKIERDQDVKTRP
jgi:hypothetical protein